jgi:biotin operon repressor
MSTSTEIFVGSLTCLQCSRSAATVRVIDGRTHLKLRQSEYAEAVRRRRCPACAGNLQIVDTRYERILHFYLTPADLVPQRGPKPKAPKPPQRYGPCVDCREPTNRHGSERCRPCHDRLVEANATTARLVVLLGYGHPVSGRQIADALNLSLSGVRSAVKRARQKGRPIASTGAGREGLYWLEMP